MKLCSADVIQVSKQREETPPQLVVPHLSTEGRLMIHDQVLEVLADRKILITIKLRSIQIISVIILETNANNIIKTHTCLLPVVFMMTFKIYCTSLQSCISNILFINQLYSHIHGMDQDFEDFHFTLISSTVQCAKAKHGLQ